MLLTAVAAFIAGCATARQPAPVDELGVPAGTRAETPGELTPSPMEVPSTGEAVTIPLGYSASPPAVSESAPPPAAAGGDAAANPAVVALLNDANLAMQNGRDDRAAASLERALSIEPRNAWLWHRLASTRLKQGELDQAAALAAKSNSFASRDRKLQAANWRIIADVHRRLGDFDAAKSAEAQATRLESP
ncbi:MAG TPA: tetratricopeptide repeat protein [Gammaproteobacteria bacterium]|nr:tetratricopeptide repeat protein [Gammaproteobacteria bacterium]